MSPASKSKVGPKQNAKAIREQPQISFKPSHVLSNGGDGAPASGTNQVVDALNTLDLSPSAPLKMQQNNVQIRIIDDTEDLSLSPTSTRNDSDSASNNDSCSGESEDQKEKMSSSTASCSGSAPVPCLDTEKREKVRLKNEKKHQRQREKRAKELHMRCTGYLKSWKVEALAQQLVAMGFPSERATMAIIQNEGWLEESVAWLLQQGEENNKQQAEENNKQQAVANIEDGGANLKVDISNELARIADLEIKLDCSKQEVERAVVCCQGDLDKAEDTLKAKKQRSLAAAAAHPKMEESDPITSNSKQEVSSGVPMARNQVNGIASHHQGVDKINLSSTESMIAEDILQEAVNRKTESLRRIHLHLAADKRWTNESSSPISYPSGFALQVAVPPVTSKLENAILGSEVKTNFQEALREPVKVMQHPQSIMTASQNFQSTSTSFGASSFTTTRRYPNGIYSMDTIALNGSFGHNVPCMDLNGVYSTDTMAMNGGLGYNLHSMDLNEIYSTDIMAINGGLGHTSIIDVNGIYNTQMLAKNGALGHNLASVGLNGSSSLHSQPFPSNATEFSRVRRTEPGSFRNSVQSSQSSFLGAPSSLGLFSGLASLTSSGKSSTIDWTTEGSMPHYASVDWSPDLTSLRPLAKAYPSLDTMSKGGKADARPKMGGGVPVAGSQDTSDLIASCSSSSAVSREDLIGVGNSQFVISPSL